MFKFSKHNNAFDLLYDDNLKQRFELASLEDQKRFNDIKQLNKDRFRKEVDSTPDIYLKKSKFSLN